MNTLQTGQDINPNGAGNVCTASPISRHMWVWITSFRVPGGMLHIGRGALLYLLH
jgi:hypothetical protein